MKHYVPITGSGAAGADALSLRDSVAGKTWSESDSKFGSRSDVGDTVVAVSR